MTRNGSALSVLAAWPPAALLPASGPPAARTRSFGCGFGPRASRWRVAGPRAAGLRESGQRISGLRGGCPRTRAYLAHAGPMGDRLDRLGGSKKRRYIKYLFYFMRVGGRGGHPVAPRALSTRVDGCGSDSQTDRQTDRQTYRYTDRQTHRQTGGQTNTQTNLFTDGHTMQQADWLTVQLAD